MSKGKQIIYTVLALIALPLTIMGILILYSYWFYPSALSETTSVTSLRSDVGQELWNVSRQRTMQNVKKFIDQSEVKYDFWVGAMGPIGPIFSGAQQIPFICMTHYNGLGQPIVDNKTGQGAAVFPELFGFPLFMLKPVGYSKYCSMHTRLDYFYYSKNKEKFLPLSDNKARPKDLAFIKNKDSEIPFIVRLERGTINRFIYSIAMLAPYPESLQSPQGLDKDAWNGKLVYKFQGGIGVGHYQGFAEFDKRQALHYDSLKRGFAVAYSTGTRTSTHYNLQLSEETAYMVKEHFKAVYGEPKYTIGLGASGGAVQQYVIAQNHLGLLDAAIPQASYSDMITQTIHVADCELLERFFDSEYLSDNSSYWSNWINRPEIEGVAANQTAVVKKWQRSPAPKPGASECMASWRGTIPTTFNPNWTNSVYFKAFKRYGFSDSEVEKIKWTHWNDLQNIYPVDEKGYAPNSWDNVGVQYGLMALKKAQIEKGEFLNLNACVGGWKQPNNMTVGLFPWDKGADKSHFDPWDQANMNLNPSCQGGKPAPRTEGNLEAMRIAYTSGHVFTGDIDIPVIDIRWYLEPVLNMHHSIASFSARARIQAFKGHANNHIIWVAACSDMDQVSLKWRCQYEPTGHALDVMTEWMDNIMASVDKNVEVNKPKSATDSCFSDQGLLIHAGDTVWDGILNKKKTGECTVKFPVYSTSRIQAGGNFKDSIFKCALKSLDDALKDGTYGQIKFNDEEIGRLKTIFPNGVCDYSKEDMALTSPR